MTRWTILANIIAMNNDKDGFDISIDTGEFIKSMDIEKQLFIVSEMSNELNLLSDDLLAKLEAQKEASND